MFKKKTTWEKCLKSTEIVKKLNISYTTCTNDST